MKTHDAPTPASATVDAPILPATVEEVDLLKFRLSLEKEQRTAQAVQLVKHAVKEAEQAFELAKKERVDASDALQKKYSITPADSIDGATGAIHRGAVS